jgi:hypothetical protein
VIRRKAPPVRRDKVLHLLQLGMVQTDEADKDIDSPEFDQAKANYGAAANEATQAELRAANDALKRHGY